MVLTRSNVSTEETKVANKKQRRARKAKLREIRQVRHELGSLEVSSKSDRDRSQPQDADEELSTNHATAISDRTDIVDNINNNTKTPSAAATRERQQNLKFALIVPGTLIAPEDTPASAASSFLTLKMDPAKLRALVASLDRTSKAPIHPAVQLLTEPIAQQPVQPVNLPTVQTPPTLSSAQSSLPAPTQLPPPVRPPPRIIPGIPIVYPLSQFDVFNHDDFTSEVAAGFDEYLTSLGVFQGNNGWLYRRIRDLNPPPSKFRSILIHPTYAMKIAKVPHKILIDVISTLASYMSAYEKQMADGTIKSTSAQELGTDMEVTVEGGDMNRGLNEAEKADEALASKLQEYDAYPGPATRARLRGDKKVIDYSKSMVSGLDVTTMKKKSPERLCKNNDVRRSPEI